jgi:hypothetical protein
VCELGRAGVGRADLVRELGRAGVGRARRWSWCRCSLVQRP